MRITNITNKLNKRDFWFNKPIIIDYADGIKNNEIKIESGETIQLNLYNIPSDVYKYKMMNLIIVDEIVDENLIKVVKDVKPKGEESKKQQKLKNNDKDTE